jgi:hypothetical protein
MGLLTLNELSGLGQVACGPKPALGPGEKSMCCPELGWVIYDQNESGYALCERAAAQASGGDPGPSSGYASTAAEYAAQVEADRRAGELELEARRQAMEARRIALEERQFQQRLQTVMIQAQLKKAARERAQSPEARAERRAAAAASAAAAARAMAAEKAAQQKKITYAALAAVAAKLLFFS